jgi:hypothetical protein
MALRLGVPPIYETPAAIVLGVGIILGYALAGQFPGGALLRGVAVGLTSAGLIATIRRFTLERRVRRR